MIIEIRGVGFLNFGAKLMLSAISRHFAERNPGTLLVLREGLADAATLRQYGVAQRRTHSRRRLARRIMDGLTQWAGAGAGEIVPYEAVDVILDASGFAYGDTWGSSDAEQASSSYEIEKRLSKKIILLPQAFGPFQDTRTADAMRSMLGSTDLVFARDEESLGYLRQFETGSERIALAPDFTNLLNVGPCESHASLRDRPCVVPNYQMLRRGGVEVNESYISFLASCVKHLESRGLRPFVLLHDPKLDNPLMTALEEETKHSIEAITESDPLAMKGIIGHSLMFVGSRYHGLVCSLSQGVPVLATAWSHKYAALVSDYNTEESLVSPLAPFEEIRSRLDDMIEGEARDRQIASLKEAAKKQKDLSRAMWGRVHEMIGDSASGGSSQ